MKILEKLYNRLAYEANDILVDIENSKKLDERKKYLNSEEFLNKEDSLEIGMAEQYVTNKKD